MAKIVRRIIKCADVLQPVKGVIGELSRKVAYNQRITEGLIAVGGRFFHNNLAFTHMVGSANQAVGLHFVY